jgi:hypothetical protein
MTKWSTFERSAAGQMTFPLVLLTDRDAYAQRLRNRFRFFLGEWFLDLRLGAPYYDYLFVKDPDPKVVRILLQRIVETLPGTKYIRNMDLDIDRQSRTCTLSNLEIEMTTGEVFFSQNETYIIKLPIE